MINRKVPKGTSTYQASWIDEEGGSGSEGEGGSGSEGEGGSGSEGEGGSGSEGEGGSGSEGEGGSGSEGEGGSGSEGEGGSGSEGEGDLEKLFIEEEGLSDDCEDEMVWKHQALSTDMCNYVSCVALFRRSWRTLQKLWVDVGSLATALLGEAPISIFIGYFN